MTENVRNFRNYYFDIQTTLFGGLRLCLKESKDSSFYLLNWCCGKDMDLLESLLEFIQTLSDEQIDKLPFCSQIKPLYDDSHFKDKLSKFGYKWSS